MAGFLGLEVNRSGEKGMITLIQTGVINNIMIATQMEDFNIKFTPEENVPMSNDLDGDP